MSTPPRTPTTRQPAASHRRQLSSLDMSHTTTTSRRPSFNRRSSGYSSSQEFEHGSPGQGGGDGLGNLADELGDVWDDDDEMADGEYGDEMDAPDEHDNIGVALTHDGPPEVGTAVNVNGVRDSGVAMPSSSDAESKTLSPQTAAKGRAHRRQRSLYDGSDYGDSSDLEANEGISPALEARMAAVESLARRGTEANGSATDGVVKRLVEQLRDLGSQIGIENGATRLKTAHDALTTHLTHQSRTLTSLSASLSGPRAVILDLEDIDALLPLITSTLELLPHSQHQSVLALSQLTIANRELLENLSNVQDSLHMTRQMAVNATRRLKSSKDQLAEWKRDQDLREAGVKWIESGDWEAKLKRRQAGSECWDVVNGFEEQCGLWRQKLCEGLGVASA
ncbi:hypothetical protein P280DRAFT_241733 [Massarina eburnea CBS 473.64]|uniref:Uncharacterized protein n=1 Tax=Massarina eburnea CBS 473.64 TaxID=1395130 RepID=A0A6A6S7L3_9PLEO|nr:hypothetical protein P280DRAFT_241733 [Massarina eburnea CBS 473.64]